jgi:hypothetical protein
MNMRAVSHERAPMHAVGAAAKCTEYVLIGQGPALPDLHNLARSFAEIDLPAAGAGIDPHRTIEVPSVSIRIWDMPGGQRRIEVDDHCGGEVSLVVSTPHSFVP